MSELTTASLCFSAQAAEAVTWTPLARAVAVPKTPEQIDAMIRHAATLGSNEAEIRALLDEDQELWMNDHVTVRVSRFPDGAVQLLSIRNGDRSAIHDWRIFQRIKNELAGPEVEAVEIYPAESRLVDTANQYWLWCLPPGVRVPFGFNERVVSGDTGDTGAVQRPF